MAVARREGAGPEAVLTLGKLRVALVVAAMVSLTGCYYGQAARGQWEVIRKREPIDEVIKDPETPDALRARLEIVNQARDYSIDELGLPDNKSYRTYADLERDYVVWNVFAAPEFSLTPQTWCFPVAGCVAYRGYFRETAARAQAEKLADAGSDVHVGGVTAYSTLGRFSDPMLNTMMRWDDVQLVAVMFHELAHQVLYVKGDSAFNESFASAVEEFGVERFLAERGREEAFASYRERKTVRRELMAAVGAARIDLEQLYAEAVDDDDKRRRKRERIERLEDDLRGVLVAANRDADAWLARPLNNARIASLVLYEGRLPAFRRMLADCDDELTCFYAEAARLAELEREVRDEALDALATRAGGSSE
jgi:predicted aminopeptidase